MWGWLGGRLMFFLAFYAISNILEKTNFGNKKQILRVFYTTSISNIFLFFLELFII